MKLSNKKILILLGIVVILGLGYFLFTKYHKKEAPNPYANSTIVVTTFANEDATFGYDVFIDGNIYVHQPNIPAVGGDKGFTTEADAQKTGELVVGKIKNNILPPSVSPDELKNLGVL